MSSLNTICISAAKRNNLKSISLNLPVPGLSAISGPVGAGKSSLLESINGEARYRMSLMLPRSERINLAIAPSSEIKVESLPFTLSSSLSDLNGRLIDALGLKTRLLSLIKGCDKYICPECSAAILPFSLARIEDLILKSQSYNCQLSALLARQENSESLKRSLGSFERFLLNGAPATQKQILAAEANSDLEIIIDELSANMLDSKAAKQSLKLAQRLASQAVVIRVLGQDGQTLNKQIFYKFGECSKCKAAAPSPNRYLAELRDGKDSKLFRAALGSSINGVSFDAILNSSFRELNSLFTAEESSLFNAMRLPLSLALRLDLGKLTFSRKVRSLSSGELARFGILRTLSFGPENSLYLFDRPMAHLSEPQTLNVLALLTELKKKETIFIADNSGLLSGSADLSLSLSPTSDSSGSEITSLAPHESHGHNALGSLVVSDCLGANPSENLIKLQIPKLHDLAARCITIRPGAINLLIGESGSGKSLTLDFLANHCAEIKTFFKGVVLVPHCANWRGSVASILGLDLRLAELIALTEAARSLGLSAKTLKKALKSLQFSAAEQQITYRANSLEQISSMRIEQLAEFFERVIKVRKVLEPLIELGLGHLRISQQFSSLSSGEQQLITLASQSYLRGEYLYTFDNPIAGLLEDESSRVMNFLNKLTLRGNTVLLTSSTAALR